MSKYTLGEQNQESLLRLNRIRRVSGRPDRIRVLVVARVRDSVGKWCKVIVIGRRRRPSVKPTM